MKHYALDVAVTRGDILESTHRVHAAVVSGTGALVGEAGNPELVTCWRSCAKPFQTMPLLEWGHADRLAWGAEEIALACASHGGEPEHVEIVARMLAAVGLEEGDLACGPHEPLSRRGARLLKESGQRLTRLYNNCSGKHAAMLACARESSWPVLGYEKALHPLQDAIAERVAAWSGVPVHRLVRAVDGCGVVAFGLPLEAMARAFARLAAAARQGDEVPARLVEVMCTHPFLLGGTDRFDTVVMEETGGRVLCKVGAEGVHTVVLRDEPLAFAVKVEDGAARAQYGAVIRLLQEFGAVPDTLPPRLASFLRTPVMNTRGEVVGMVQPMQ